MTGSSMVGAGLGPGTPEGRGRPGRLRPPVLFGWVQSLRPRRWASVGDIARTAVLQGDRRDQAGCMCFAFVQGGGPLMP